MPKKNKENDNYFMQLMPLDDPDDDILVQFSGNTQNLDNDQITLTNINIQTQNVVQNNTLNMTAPAHPNMPQIPQMYFTNSNVLINHNFGK